MGARGTVFSEVMAGSVLLSGESEARAMRLDLSVRAGDVLLPHRTIRGAVTGRVRIAGWADDAQATGELEISPLARRRIRYRIDFTAQGRRHSLDGWKSISLGRPVKSMTVLPFSFFEDGEEAGKGTLRFPLSTQLLPFLASFRFPRSEDQAAQLAPRWDGSAGRTEVWYTTVTDPATRSGLWLHHELVAPADGSDAYAHGWVARFPADGEGPVEHARFGPEPWKQQAEARGFSSDGIEAGPGRLRGAAGPFSWDLAEHPQDEPLFTFPRWSWRRQLLPAAQIVPAPHASYTGTFAYDGGELRLDEAPGATARIYGHGNARRWAWLHAGLGGGDVLEIVAATSMRPGLRRLPPLVFLRLRKDGRTWPRRPERTAVGWAGLGRFKARVSLPTWTVSGRSGLRRIRVEVTQPDERTLALDYTDPDGSGAVCRNSETADARIVLERWWGRWRTESEWTLDGTAHAEVGDR
ncbi:hypothetical protein G4Z16_03055 [Streptomyces bathyalis]|uniref:Uncharacterized protein n=1 Tax=Streptomyces bathyalis TaxID=2710756 RepID=A0A7T1T374_9ACTN|nr:hypothetical protein [Streptomyces bathyalis]QPP05538.1 hypothetical protein G4Z16_03055 [Streptomyces bathyalis]